MTQDLMLDPMDPGEPAGPHLVRDTAPPPGRELRVVSEKPRVDLAAAERAAEDFLTALASTSAATGSPGPRPGWPAPTRICSTRGRSG